MCSSFCSLQTSVHLRDRPLMPRRAQLHHTLLRFTVIIVLADSRRLIHKLPLCWLSLNEPSVSFSPLSLLLLIRAASDALKHYITRTQAAVLLCQPHVMYSSNGLASQRTAHRREAGGMRAAEEEKLRPVRLHPSRHALKPALSSSAQPIDALQPHWWQADRYERSCSCFDFIMFN